MQKLDQNPPFRTPKKLRKKNFDEDSSLGLTPVMALAEVGLEKPVELAKVVAS